MRRRTIAATLAVAAVALACASPASARHGEAWGDAGTCPAYSTESGFYSNETTIAEGIKLAAEAVYAGLDRADAKGPAKAAGAAALAAAESAHLAINGQNRLAIACYDPRHWQLQDDLMKMTIQANLALTSAADISLVMPEKRPSGHVPPTTTIHSGFIDRERPDAQNDVEGWDVIGTMTTVRGVIDAMKEAEQCTCGAAESAYGQAVTAMRGGQYKTAYRLFRQAYVYAFSN
jgi:hypothetical protein